MTSEKANLSQQVQKRVACCFLRGLESPKLSLVANFIFNRIEISGHRDKKSVFFHETNPTTLTRVPASF